MAPMKFISERKGFPLLGVFGILVGVNFIAMGAWGFGDPALRWFQIFLGIFLLVSWTGRILNDVVQVVVDDNEIRYIRRKTGDLAIPWKDVIDSEISRSSIEFRYKGPHDIQIKSIPFRRFQADEAERLWEIFSHMKQTGVIIATNNEHKGFPILGVLSVTCALIGPFVAWAIGSSFQRHDGSGASWAPAGLFASLAIYALICIFGTILSIIGLKRAERWPAIAKIGLLLNGAVLILCVLAVVL